MAYSHMIPISLYVMIEMAKVCLAKIINDDVKMFFAEDLNWAQSRNGDLIEELGQVEFVFSDKTGTLTQNKMEFKKAQIDSIVYGNTTAFDEQNHVAENEGMRQSSVDRIKGELLDYFKSGDAQSKQKKRKNAAGPGSEGAEALYSMFRLLAVCHTVVVENGPTGLLY